MSDSTRASVLATLTEIRAKPFTPGREKAKAKMQAALARMSAHAARASKGGPVTRAMTTHDRESLMTIADDATRSDGERDRAKAILDGDGDLRHGDVEFLKRAS
ncbi:hypothetical protein ILP92_17910 [Maribius pontilimi]|uniref:Uncharacterized protein n=1 Tax=Palleronia pontilimi TaxID=1964209 RepID=A0A934MBC7_9RHOB|nr:hypothetical protein [Palleronia pontilimi]MBJ3764612.1 hypothetical protein [Palleronia pontilimi]